ncbi:unnamed protein product, partial [Rotaria sp. Silwood2]
MYRHVMSRPYFVVAWGAR